MMNQKLFLLCCDIDIFTCICKDVTLWKKKKNTRVFRLLFSIDNINFIFLMKKVVYQQKKNTKRSFHRIMESDQSIDSPIPSKKPAVKEKERKKILRHGINFSLLEFSRAGERSKKKNSRASLLHI